MTGHIRQSPGFAILVAAVLVVAGCAPTGTVEPEPVPAAAAGNAGDLAAPTSSAPSPSPSPSAVPSPSARPLLERAPVVTKRTVSETRPIAFRTRTVEDPDLAKGTTRVRTKGVKGVRTLTFELTLTDGKQTARRLVSDVVTREPVTKVVVVGTKVESSRCDPNYSGCVPVASDVDCAGGSGNGPAYVDGPVDVIGQDIYGLDSDDDGVGCE
jgi:hypothetical protein